jgi:hypothetical protein
MLIEEERDISLEVENTAIDANVRNAALAS